jgi:predicted TIM-barrel fold metal-dependent hydrolase
MPGVDIHSELGAGAWVTTDAGKLQGALQRARYDLMAVASRRALAGDIAAGNAEVKAVLDAFPQARGWVVINPAYPERSSEEMRRYLGSAKWLGAMLHPTLCGQSLISAATSEVLNAYRRYTKPLLIHVPDEPAVRELEAVAKEFNTLKFVAGGAGGEAWHSCLVAAKRTTNIFLEPFTGGQHRGKLEAILEVLGAHRVLFASGYPNLNPGAALGMLLDAKISDGDKQTILTASAIRLFGLTRTAE